jgi:PAS domain S-box-containing protein
MEMTKRPLLIFIPFLLITTILLGVNFLGMEILSAVTAYVGGEGLYSKGQKDAVYHLNRYVITEDESEYFRYKNAISAPLGDQIARKELLKSNTNFQIVYDGFVQGKNDKRDVQKMALLFKYGQHTSFMKTAIQIWSDGDSHINSIDSISQQLHFIIENNTGEQTKIDSLLNRLIIHNDKLTVLEDNFSITLGAAGRKIKNLIIVITLIISLILFIFCVYVAMLIIKRVRESGEKYQQLFSESHDCIFITDLKGNILDLNVAGMKMLEISGIDEIKKNNAVSFYETKEKRTELINSLKKYGFVQNKEVMFRSKGGRKIFALMTANAVHNRKGDLIYIRGIIKDISALKRVEEQLIQKNRELEKTNMELDRFVYTTSHDLRAPLTSIIGLIDIIRDEKNENEKMIELDMMEKSVKKLDNFISDVISYARNSQTELNIEEIDFNALISESLDTYKYIKNMERIDIQLNINQDKKFYSDKKRLSIVMNNLLSNAIKYHNYQQENLFIKIYVDVNNDNAIISVKDNGKGIAKEHHTKIFDMFYMVASSRSGTGLGLYIVKETIERLKGKIILNSQQGVGTEFIITIPDLKDN